MKHRFAVKIYIQFSCVKVFFFQFIKNVADVFTWQKRFSVLSLVERMIKNTKAALLSLFY